MQKIARRFKSQLVCSQENEAGLATWIKLYTGLHIPRTPVCPHHSAPFEYIRRAYFEPARDVIVWAPRGGGKTRLAALATLLDLLHKPGCSVRILGGSMEQSLRMWEHLFPDLTHLASHLLQGKARNAKRIQLCNGSTAAVLAQSDRAVRGLRVQKLRCDEVEMFEAKIWEAAQLVTRSVGQRNRVSGIGCRVSGRKDLISPPETRNPTPDTRFVPETRSHIHGAIEALSTFHKPWGLMSRIIENAPARNTPIVHWCILEVLERCPPERDCTTCPLWNDCGGIAKTKCDGFVSIDDAIAMKQRVSLEIWESEMLCKRPSISGSVFPSFKVDVHVRDHVESAGEGAEMSLAIDFGFAAPFVCLWIRTHPDGVTHVMDEYVREGVVVEDHIKAIRARKHDEIVRIACDPAGAGRNEQTAMSNVTLLRRSGFVVRYKASQIVDGIEMIRAQLRPASGAPMLFIHPRCVNLIKAMQGYHYALNGSEKPEKDGTHDHLIDALRYHFVNRPMEKGPGRRY